MTLFELVQMCMALVTMDNGLLCGRSYHRCVPGGPSHGV